MLLLVVVVHLVHTVVVVALLTLTSRRWAGRVATTPVAALAECAKDADLLSINLCLHLRALLCLLHLDDDDQVTLAVLPSFRVDVDIVDLIVALDDGYCARTLPFEAHNLRCTPIKLALGAYLFLMHLLRDVIVGNSAVARFGVVTFQDGLQDPLGKTDGPDGALPRDRLSVCGNAHAVVDISVKHTVDVKNHISKVLRALTVVGYEELVCRTGGEVHWRLGGGGGITATLSWLPWRGLELGQHGGVAVVLGGSIVGSGVSVINGGVVFVALVTVNLFV